MTKVNVILLRMLLALAVVISGIALLKWGFHYRISWQVFLPALMVPPVLATINIFSVRKPSR
jgi:hypothetical protein